MRLEHLDGSGTFFGGFCDQEVNTSNVARGKTCAESLTILPLVLPPREAGDNERLVDTVNDESGVRKPHP